MAVYGKLEDRELSALLKEGNAMAFTEIYHRYHSLLYIYAHKKLNDKQEAEDIIQEVLTTLWNRRYEITLQVSLSSYLYTAVRNRALDIFAHRKVEARYLHSLQAFMEQQTVRSSDFLVRENDLKTLIEKEIKSLPPRMREVFELSRTERLSHSAIAELLGISEHTVATQIKRALRVLRMRLGLLAWLYLMLFR